MHQPVPPRNRRPADPYRDPERYRDRNPERYRDRTPDRNPGRYGDRTPDRYRDRTPDRNPGRYGDRTPNRAPDRYRDRAPERYRDRTAEWYRNGAPERRKAGPGSRNQQIIHAAGLAGLAVLTPLNGSWAVEVLLVPALLILPGVILLQALRVPGKSIAMFPVYVPTASIVVLLFSGLAIDLVGPRIGIAAPLSVGPLLMTLEIICLALLACSLNAPPRTQIPWSSLSAPAKKAWPLLIPVLSAAGALRLNTGHSAAVAYVAIIVVLLAVIAGFLFTAWCDYSLLMVGIFALGLAMMWSFSLRGDGVYGFDISNEYYEMQQTVTSGVWTFNHADDAYGAMLSLTVLPAQLHALTGIPALLVLKAVYPIIGALFPVAVFNLARRILTGRWAFMAASLVLMQQTFIQQMPALARQEVATLLFAALLLAIFDPSLPQFARWAFVSLLSSGIVVSHYSTAYLAIALLGLAIVFQWLVSWFRQVPRLTGAALLACVISVAGTAVWYGALTHSSSNVSQFVQTTQGQGIDLLPNQGGSLLATYLQGESQQQMTPAQFEAFVHKDFSQNDKFIKPLPNASEPQYALKPAADQSPPVTSNTGTSVVDLANLLIQQLLNVLAGLSALILTLQRKAPTTVRLIGLLGLAGMVILTLARLSGTVAEAYNPQRAFLQMLIILSISICWMFQRVGRRWKKSRSIILAIGAVSFALFFIGSSGFEGALFGGGTAANLANSGDDYQQFVKTTPDVVAASWVNQAAPPGQFIYADNYAGLILISVAGNRTGVFDAIMPETLDQHAWVYASTTNLTDNIVRALSGNTAAAYAFPGRFLTANYNLVYTNGSSEVFHR